MKRNRKRSYRREVLLQTVRGMQRIASGLFEVLNYEVVDQVSKENIRHFSRGFDFVLSKIRE